MNLNISEVQRSFMQCIALIKISARHLIKSYVQPRLKIVQASSMQKKKSAVNSAFQINI